MKQRIAFLLLLAAFTARSGADDSGYEILGTNHRENGIRISFPQLLSRGDLRTQTTINGRLRDEAMSALKFFDPERRNSLELSISFRVLRKSPGLLSIAYSGDGGTIGSATRRNLYFTTTLDFQSFKRLSLPDFVLIDKRLAQRLKEARILDPEKGIPPAQADAIRAEIRSRDDAYLVDLLFGADRTNLIGTEREPEIFSGISTEALIVSVWMPPELGGHAEFVLPFGEISDLLLPEYRALAGK